MNHLGQWQTFPFQKRGKALPWPRQVDVSPMIKALALAVSGVLVGSAALAGPYVNVENNGGYQDGFLGSTTDIHVGFEGSSDVYGYYVQAGPAFVFEDGSDTETEISGKVGVGVDVTEQLNIYGEIAFLTEDRSFEEDLNVGVKGGATFRF